MAELTIKRLLGLKGINAVTEKEFEADLSSFQKKDFIEFLVSIPKDNIQFLFNEEQPDQEEEKDDMDDI